MEINTLNYKGDGTFRQYTLSSAVHELIDGLEPGQMVVIDGVRSLDGEKINIASFRASLNHVKNEAFPEKLFVTKSVKSDYPIRVIRVK